MSLELSIATLSIIGIIILFWLIKKFWKHFGSDVIEVLEKLFSIIWNIIKFVFKIFFFCGVGLFFFYFIFGGFFGAGILSYFLSVVSVIGIILIISKKRGIHPICMFLGHNWKYERYAEPHYDYERNYHSGVSRHCKRKGCSAF